MFQMKGRVNQQVLLVLCETPIVDQGLNSNLIYYRELVVGEHRDPHIVQLLVVIDLVRGDVRPEKYLPATLFLEVE